ncbi:hypothetical protein SLEP1_g54766 [Rubroshorea leprosula]|uniref:Leucine-rich repeat-containing N-terminal plant-type domain-containing protein n=1 Tax=Rubroshorea leprosula TaxID=152421 RepID=A0AAV5MDF7_9ROSI|nr:hypothetical protein SLEP1_g54766 [Rubroshorea leprosula]
MKILGAGFLNLVYALLILLHMQTSIGSNSTTADDGVKCIESERQALLSFKQGLVDEHGWLSSWGSEEEKKNCCEWEGVQCSNTTGHIIMLNLTTYFILRGIEYPCENLTLQRTIDLSSNKLTGEIPIQMASLSEMHQLNLSRNYLTGRIPPDIGQMRQLESLDLSHNKLSGQLPPSMSQLYSLSKLDLSYNNFSGKIPTSTQMDTFNASAFVGNNPTLCGPPLTPSCPGDEKLIDDGLEYNQKDKDEFWKGFKPSMKLGMAFGFMGVLAFKIDHPWKRVCFLLSNHMKVYLSNLEGYLCLVVSALCLVITVNAARLRRKLKF